MKLNKEDRMSSSLLDGTEILNDINGIPFVVAMKTGFPWRPGEVAEILSMGMVDN